ncbi:[formate-C-acetyltransferase]-activating enzyme [Clostridium paridis]|uniref:[formate-C-acetyltransferase]-activating enzyme n=1 Tax=Clostridium paridis TaxID=2803863 RepID=A0A937FJE8_9CLOT|nr:[formate-C-acetyltransferase]-activating enzyme [Clostridium paridis]MBL4933393.1 [formate-C-acetyltransferase]-activating enzyme [Clostridium paridis]
MKKGYVFNIQKYCLHDGEGIRTVVFFKGCPLSCPWCSNPESQSFNREIIRKNSLCIKCSAADCYKCSKNPESCPTGALEYVGQEYTIEELLEIIKEDMVFYDSTEGGVTLSGGEVLSQGEFACALLKRVKELGINTAIETSGYGNFETLRALAEYTDTILFDLKIMDNEKAQKIIKANSEVIKNNLRGLVSLGHKVIPRIPLIPGYTMEEDNIEEIKEFVISIGIKEVHLLPLHQYGSSKYRGINKKYELKDINPPKSEEIDEVRSIFESSGIKVVIGG